MFAATSTKIMQPKNIKDVLVCFAVADVGLDFLSCSRTKQNKVLDGPQNGQGGGEGGCVEQNEARIVIMLV